MVYRAVVLSILLYGAETWAIKANILRRLDVFHNRCVGSILGVSRYQQWKERLTTKQLSAQFGMQWSIDDCILDQRLRWLGHLGRMDDDRLPKKLLFGELLKKRPFHDAKKRWRDVVMSDLRDMGVGVDWYCLCHDGLNFVISRLYGGRRAPFVLLIREHQTWSFSVLVEGTFTGGVT